MKLIHKSLYTVLIASSFSILTSCDLTKLDINQDPNNPREAAPNLILASAGLGTANAFENVNQSAHGFVGILASFDSFNMNNNSWNGTWNYFYETPAKDIDGLIKSTTAAGNNPRYLGVAQVMKVYLFSLMADSFGDIPYSQALDGDGSGNLNPQFENAKDIYTDLIKLCDDAVANLNESSSVNVQGDLFYNGDLAKWTKLAKTLKLRLLVQSRRAQGVDNKAAVQAIIDEGDIIKAGADDFVFRYNRLAAPEGRHPWYQAAYAASNSAFTYILHQYMYEMIRDEDPRVPFYFKRQFSRILNPNDPTDKSTIPCSQATGCRYSYWVLNPFVWKTLYTDKGKTPTKADTAYIAGFFGRDRGDISGVPADVDFRTSPGAYPAAGQYDRPAPSRTGGVNTRGAGDGISPMITSWMTKFYQIEAILTMGVTGDAKALFQAAMDEQMTKVQAIGLAADPTNAKAMDAAAKKKYIDLYLARYDAAPTNEAKLNVVLKQAWFANYGNGYEIWNAYRRTGYPVDVQIPIARIRNFALRLPYPAQELSLNSSAPKEVPAFDNPSSKLFWDVLGIQYQ